MYKNKNAKPLSKKQKVKTKRIKPMDTSLSIIDRYVEPILPEKTSYKFKESDIFETSDKKAKIKTKLKKR
mgnify:CR=1 FL=1|tara:strand:+ start:1742 stop:1951 length:210 start_codon:yes stop_codon:yes gene_type:complete